MTLEEGRHEMNGLNESFSFAQTAIVILFAMIATRPFAMIATRPFAMIATRPFAMIATRP